VELINLPERPGRSGERALTAAPAVNEAVDTGGCGGPKTDDDDE